MLLRLRMIKNKKLACEFFYVFSRFEFALKASGFVHSQNGVASPYWDEFAKSIDEKHKLEKLPSEDFQKSVEYFFSNPPKKQIVKEGKLEWKEVGESELPTNFLKLLALVRKVRNNFFHGGKFPSGPVHGSERDEFLLEYSLIILKECLELNKGVKRIFEEEPSRW